MSWRAMFIDGPLEGREHDRTFMGSWQRELRFAPITHAGDRWVLVGTEVFDDSWPGQVTYVRDDARSQLIECEPGEFEGWAIYAMREVRSPFEAEEVRR